MNKHWQTITAFGICVIAISVAYYFILFLPKQKQAENMLQNQSQCMSNAQKYINQNNIVDGYGFTYTHQNHFDTKLKKCFVLISGYNFKEDFLTVDLYDALEGKHYATYNGHSICDTSVLAMTNQDVTKCQVDSGQIWFDGNDTRNPADINFGFRGTNYGGGSGDENTQKDFMLKIQPFLTD